MYVVLHLHSTYIFMAKCLIKHNNFAFLGLRLHNIIFDIMDGLKYENKSLESKGEVPPQDFHSCASACCCHHSSLKRWVVWMCGTPAALHKGAQCHRPQTRSESHRGSLGSIPDQVMWHLWWTKWHWRRFSPSTSISPANSYSTSCSIFYHPIMQSYTDNIINNLKKKIHIGIESLSRPELFYNAILIPSLTLTSFTSYLGARGSVVGWGPMLKARRSQVWLTMSLDFSFNLILPATLWPRNEYHVSSWGVKGSWPARKADNLTATCEPTV
jgi:hypothetical protein